jgi:hypothetical protein
LATWGSLLQRMPSSHSQHQLTMRHMRNQSKQMLVILSAAAAAAVSMQVLLMACRHMQQTWGVSECC